MSLSRDALADRMRKLKVSEADLEESFARSSGPGGQHVNKVATAVTLRHRPSGISVTVQDSRSQAVNRKLARERLLDAIERAREDTRAAQVAAREKERRQKSPRPTALKKRILESKRKRGELKKQRAKIQL
jgi:peptide chain release factor